MSRTLLCRRHLCNSEEADESRCMLALTQAALRLLACSVHWPSDRLNTWPAYPPIDPDNANESPWQPPFRLRLQMDHVWSSGSNLSRLPTYAIHSGVVSMAATAEGRTLVQADSGTQRAASMAAWERMQQTWVAFMHTLLFAPPCRNGASDHSIYKV